MNLYRFSPIASEDVLKTAIHHVVEQELVLAEKTVGTGLPITYLTIFAHFEQEYQDLTRIIQGWGETSDANNGVKVLLAKPIAQNGQTIHEIRVRKPDPYRAQVGCCDFGVQDYEDFKSKNLPHNPNLRLIVRPSYDMLEFFDPDVDVLAYVVGPTK